MARVLKTCRKVNALGGSWKGGVVMLGGGAPPAGQIQIPMRQVFLHCPAGGKKVQLPSGEIADHSAPQNDREVLQESVSTAISFATEGDFDAWAVLGDFNLTQKEAADNSNNVGE